MQAWGQVVLTNVATGGNLTQFYPDFVPAGTGGTATGTSRRTPTEGVLQRIEINPSGAVGGTFELWDICGLNAGVSDNVDTGSVLTTGFLAAKKARNEAKLLWKIDFKGDSGLTNKILGSRIVFTYGLAGRYLNDTDAVGTKEMQVNIIAGGGYKVITIAG